MARIAFFAFYYLLLAPVVWVSLSWMLIAYRPHPNYPLFAVLNGFVLLAPIAVMLKNRLNRRKLNDQVP